MRGNAAVIGGGRRAFPGFRSYFFSFFLVLLQRKRKTWNRSLVCLCLCLSSIDRSISQAVLANEKRGKGKKRPKQQKAKNTKRRRKVGGRGLLRQERKNEKKNRAFPSCSPLSLNSNARQRCCGIFLLPLSPPEQQMRHRRANHAAVTRSARPRHRAGGRPAVSREQCLFLVLLPAGRGRLQLRDPRARDGRRVLLDRCPSRRGVLRGEEGVEEWENEERGEGKNLTCFFYFFGRFFDLLSPLLFSPLTPVSLPSSPPPSTNSLKKQDQPGGGGRFVESYKKQFREQEARSLRDRVAPRRKRKEGGVFGKGGGGNGSDGSGGGGGVFGGVLGVLVGRATGDSSSASNSPSKEKGDAELFLPPECECLAAVEVPEEGEEEGEVGERNDDDKENTSSSPSSSCSSSSVVLGALDIRPPFSAGGGHPAGVPLADEGGCAVLNVAVHPSSRRRGVARALLSRAAEMASSKWQAGALYTTVAATNAGARALYADFGFVEVVVAAEEQQGGGGSSSTTLVGQELLLRADL